MSADLLREAASTMRVRAKAAAAQSGPEWKASARVDGAVWIEPAHLGMHGYRSTAEHIAAWHPAVALAVADWLESTADHSDSTGGHCVCDEAALAVARAHLAGGDR